MNFSILIATYKRNTLLIQTLNSFCQLVIDNLSFEVLVVDNADDIDTKHVVESFKDKLNIQYFVQKERGKNRALNLIIPKAQGEVIVFTDDDIIADKNWLIEIWRGVNRWPQYFMFGGRILPYNPEIIPAEFKQLSNYSHVYAVSDWGHGEKEFDQVFGPNMIVRRELFDKNHRFLESIGPFQGSYISGSETEFVLRMKALGYRAIYFPKALVYHQIRSEQTTIEWLMRRAYIQGQSVAWFERDIDVSRILGVPRYLYRQLVGSKFKYFISLFTKNKFQEIEQNYKYNYARGAIHQYWIRK